MVSVIPIHYLCCSSNNNPQTDSYMVRLFYSQTLSLTRFFVFLLLLANIGCQKEMSKDTLGSGGTVGGGGSNSGGTAVFKLVPAGNNCSDAVVTGVIEAGTTLAADAVITVTVDVTKVGDWTYSTATADGFSFVGTGIFTATGSQVITLYGVGKPTRAGVFSFSLTIGGGSCLLPVLVAPAGTGGGGGNGGTITGDFYYKLTLAGTNYSQDVTSTNNYIADAGVAGTPDAMFAGGISYNTSTLPAGATEFGITKGTLHNYTETQAEFKQFFSPGNYPYATINSTGTGLTNDGIALTWIEPGGNDSWSTLDGSLQSGSTFKIVSATEVTDASGYYLKVKVQFTCKLYSINGISNGQLISKAVTNGEAVVKFVMK
jgi:hypothetical protein